MRAPRDIADAVQLACETRALVYHSIGDYSLPADGFCGKCPAARLGEEGWVFHNAGKVEEYVRRAVVEKLQRDGIVINPDFNIETLEWSEKVRT